MTNLGRIKKQVRETLDAYVFTMIPALLAGNTDPKTIKRSICAAGHKAMFNKKIWSFV